MHSCAGCTRTAHALHATTRLAKPPREVAPHAGDEPVHTGQQRNTAVCPSDLREGICSTLAACATRGHDKRRGTRGGGAIRAWGPPGGNRAPTSSLAHPPSVSAFGRNPCRCSCTSCTGVVRVHTHTRTPRMGEQPCPHNRKFSKGSGGLGRQHMDGQHSLETCPPSSRCLTH